jgi:hypothetical protein
VSGLKKIKIIVVLGLKSRVVTITLFFDWHEIVVFIPEWGMLQFSLG